jgi:hypothetical protein
MRTHCDAGHDLSVVGVTVSPSYRGRCRECRHITQRAAMQRYNRTRRRAMVNERYRGTAKGMLSAARNEANRRGT